jgi:spore germination protein YaaH
MKKYAGFKYLLEKRKLEGSVGKQFNANALIRAAFYTPWNSAALHDLIKNGNKLNTIYPEWFFIDTLQFDLQTRIDSGGLAAMRNNKLSIQPMLTNFFTHRTSNGEDSGYFDSRLAHMILSNPIKRAHLIQQIKDTIHFYHFQGLNLDFEELAEKSNDALSLFQKNYMKAYILKD